MSICQCLALAASNTCLPACNHLWCCQVTGVVEDREGTAHYILSGTWDDKMESAKIVDSSQGCGGSEGKQKMVYQTLQPKLLWKKYPLPYDYVF